jgi:glutaredoxin 2
MKKKTFYQLKKSSDLPIEKGRIYLLMENSKIDEIHFFVKIGVVHAIFIDRVIISNCFEFITQNPQKIFDNFKEISYENAKSKVDNTQALLSKQIFKR